MNTFRAALAIALLTIGMAYSATTGAAPARQLRVLIVVETSDDLFAERIKAEVSALGLEVVMVEPWRTGEAVESLDAAGRNNQAIAAIRMVPSRKGVEIWFANQPAGRTLLRQLIIDERASAPNEGLVALQTAELLRTTLLRFEGPAAAPTAPPVRAPAPTPVAQVPAAPAPSTAPSTGMQAAVGFLFSPKADDRAVQAWLTLGRKILGPVGIALDLSAPLRQSTIRGPEGSASVGAWLAGAALFVRWERPAGSLYAMAAAGAAAIRLDITGHANLPLVDSTQAPVVGAGYVRVDCGFAVAPWLRLGLRGVAGAVPAGVGVRFAQNDAGVWGRPFLGTLMVADLSW